MKKYHSNWNVVPCNKEQNQKWDDYKNTASNSSLAILFPPKIIKPTHRLWKSMNSVWTLKAIDQKSHDGLKIICVYMAPGCAPAANCHPLPWWVSFFFFPGRNESVRVWTQRRSSGACQGWKICLTKEECKFQKRREWNVLVDSSREDRCFQLFSKKNKTWKVILFFQFL